MKYNPLGIFFQESEEEGESKTLGPCSGPLLWIKRDL